ncbi:MAG: tetratricopeptide repeat protein [Endozoicomonas sp.]
MSSYDRKGWDNLAHQLWQDGKKNDAIQQILETLNAHGEKKPKASLLQLCYYLYFLNDFTTCVALLKNSLQFYPDDHEILMNLAACLNRGGNHEDAISCAEKCISLEPENYTLWDTLTASCYRTGQYQKASEAGTRSLTLKDRQHGTSKPSWSLPSLTPSEFAADKKKVISFSLWGNNTRYLHGALRNVLLAPDIYSGWELWLYVDNSVPEFYRNLLQSLGGKLILQEDNQSLKEKLCWRFKVVNAECVGYFLIRDADSVISVREYNAVQAWIESDKWFHIIRDWWTHTDLVLAGLWGGVAGVLPDIREMLVGYNPTNVETPNIDQWFLRDELWSYLKTSCLIHDRCFKQVGASPLPGPLPSDNFHVGCCEASQRPDFQKKMLEPWLGV